jgi:hypothetical protein
MPNQPCTNSLGASTSQVVGALGRLLSVYQTQWIARSERHCRFEQEVACSQACKIAGVDGHLGSLFRSIHVLHQLQGVFSVTRYIPNKGCDECRRFNSFVGGEAHKEGTTVIVRTLFLRFVRETCGLVIGLLIVPIGH